MHETLREKVQNPPILFAFFDVWMRSLASIILLHSIFSCKLFNHFNFSEICISTIIIYPLNKSYKKLLVPPSFVTKSPYYYIFLNQSSFISFSATCFCFFAEKSSSHRKLHNLMTQNNFSFVYFFL